MKFTLVLILLFGLYSCRRSSNCNRTYTKINDTYKSIYTDTFLNAKLELAFKLNSLDTLKKFFIDWNKSVKPNTIDYIEQNDTVKAVFEIYREFYKPLDLLKLGNWEWGNRLNSDCKYVVVQNKLFYAVITSDNFDDFKWRYSHKDSICNFRPPLNMESKKVLYLTSEYYKSLNHFLGTESSEIGTPNIMNPSRPADESKKRYEMIRLYIPILHGHWGGYWHLESHPDVFVILLNKNLTAAKIDFRVGYQGGEAFLKKGFNGWRIDKSKATWIE